MVDPTDRSLLESARRLVRAARVPLAAAGLLLAAAAATWLSRPTVAAAFTTLGESLGLDQRDFRVFNNFADTQANDNTIPHPNFPGHTGAVMAIWKAHAEWGSEPRGGNGLGDGLASNPVLGDGGANFDNTFQGLARDSGGANGNVHAALPGLGGATLTLVMTPAADGWQILYNDDFTWDDGPGPPVFGALDLQGFATHEIGHTLGLGHSSVAGATMAPSLSGSGWDPRSIEADDIAGIQAIYGVKSASKPHIGSLSGSTDVGGALTINGSQFAPTGNEVWFTNSAADGTPLKVTGVSSTAGGTQIDVTIPADAAAGEVLVHTPGSSGATLSNAFPIDIGSPPGAFMLSGPGVPGSSLNPQLTASGDLTPGSGVVTLFVQLVKPDAPGFLFVGLTEGNVPFKGGFFDPVPILAQVPLTTNLAGKVTLPAAIPPGLPSALTIVTQTWWSDAAAVQGVSATNSLTLILP
jgi:hypothetical protein